MGALNTSSSLLRRQISVLGGAVIVKESESSEMFLGSTAPLAVSHFAVMVTTFLLFCFCFLWFVGGEVSLVITVYLFVYGFR